MSGKYGLNVFVGIYIYVCVYVETSTSHLALTQRLHVNDPSYHKHVKSCKLSAQHATKTTVTTSNEAKTVPTKLWQNFVYEVIRNVLVDDR